MKILFTTHALSIGGIEVLALRLSEAFADAGHQITLYDFNPDRRSAPFVAQYDTTRFQLAGFTPGPVADWLTWKTNAVLFKTGWWRNTLRDTLTKRHFARFLATHEFDVICSLSFHEDYLACQYAAAKQTPVVVSMHGTYEHAAPEWPQRARAIYESVRAIIYLADKNMAWYRAQPYFNPNMPLHKIYTGTDLGKPVPATLNRVDVGLSTEAFVFILVARGVAEKGWQQAIEALLSLRGRYPEAALLLVGEGEFIAEMRLRYAHEPGIIFYGKHPNPLELVRLAQVGLLPTYFSLESLPVSVMEYLRCALPVVATDIGEIADMLRLSPAQTAGTVLALPPDGGPVAVSSLAQAMEQYLADPAFYQTKVGLAERASLKFDIRECVAKYTQVFTEVLSLP